MTRRALSLLTTFNFWQRFLQLNLGLMVFGIAISLMLRANIGLDPWSVLHQGLSDLTGLSFGRITQLIGLALVGVNFWILHLRPGLGTLFNMLLVGFWVDTFEVQAWLPLVAEGSWLWGVGVFTSGVLLMGLASGLYIGARFGAGPRDDFVLGSALKLGRSVRLTRSSLELSVLALGFLAGGSLGLGTVMFALLIGPTMQFFLWLFRYDRTPNLPAISPVTSASASD